MAIKSQLSSLYSVNHYGEMGKKFAKLKIIYLHGSQFMMLFSPESLACKSTIETIACPSSVFMFPRSPICRSSESGPPWLFCN